jgi:hypothetical protein
MESRLPETIALLDPIHLGRERAESAVPSTRPFVLPDSVSENHIAAYMPASKNRNRGVPIWLPRIE